MLSKFLDRYFILTYLE